MTMNHSRWYVDPQTGAHTKHLERAWHSIKEQVLRQRGNQTEKPFYISQVYKMEYPLCH